MCTKDVRNVTMLDNIDNQYHVKLGKYIKKFDSILFALFQTNISHISIRTRTKRSSITKHVSTYLTFQNSDRHLLTL
jgi:hypothetical protein